MLKPIELRSRSEVLDERYRQRPARSAICIRLSAELHAALRAESHRRDVSLNELCVALLNNAMCKESP